MLEINCDSYNTQEIQNINTSNSYVGLMYLYCHMSVYMNDCKHIAQKAKVKEQFTLEQATKSQRGSRGLDLLFH
jgi:hypothetical protein